MGSLSLETIYRSVAYFRMPDDVVKDSLLSEFIARTGSDPALAWDLLSGEWRHSLYLRWGSFPFVPPPPPPSLVGAYYLQPPDARAIFLHNDLLCNDTCSVTGGSITYWGGGAQTEKILRWFICQFLTNMFSCLIISHRNVA